MKRDEAEQRCYVTVLYFHLVWFPHETVDFVWEHQISLVLELSLMDMNALISLPMFCAIH